MKFYKISDSKLRIREYEVPAGTCNIRVDFEGKISIHSLSGAIFQTIIDS